MLPKRPVPGLPHPDVAIVEGVFRDMKPGETVTFDDVAKAINVPIEDLHIVKSRAKRARDRLARLEEINVTSAHAVGYYRETSADTLERTKGRERPSIRRKARKVTYALNGVDTAELDETQRQEYCAERVIAHMTYKANCATSKRVLLAVAKTSQNQLPMAVALEILKKG